MFTMTFNYNTVTALIEIWRQQDFSIFLGTISEYKRWIIFKMAIKRANLYKKREHICMILHPSLSEEYPLQLFGFLGNSLRRLPVLLNNKHHHSMCESCV